MDKYIESLILKYFDGNISLDDEQYLLEWLKNNPEAVRDINGFRRIWNMLAITDSLTGEVLEAEWQRLLQKLDPKKNEKRDQSWSLQHRLPKIAAVFMIGAGLSFAISYLYFNHPSSDLTYHEITTPQGARSIVTLPDGSTIWLNAGSSLKYSSGFGKKDRLVHLTGEAFFNVFHNPEKEFHVKTSELIIKAYGTAFNLKSYPEEGTIEATLIEGNIGVTRMLPGGKKKDELFLEPNQRVVYNRKDKCSACDTKEEQAGKAITGTSEKRKNEKLTYLISKGIDTKEFTAWKEGTLFINSRTLQELAIILERKYDVRIHFTDQALKTLKFSGSLENETVEQVICAIAIAARIEYEIDGRDIWLDQKSNDKQL